MPVSEARIGILAGACILVGFAVRPADARDIIVGVNSWYTPPDVSRDDMVKQLAASGVKTIRISLLPNSVDLSGHEDALSRAS